MTLGEKRRKFTHMLAMLILHAEDEGFGVAVDFVKRCEDCRVGHRNSTHKKGLAADLHLYRDGVYLDSGEEHKTLHDFWDSMGGSARIDHDLNHYSLEDGGVR